jgi:hypothetical protein
MEEEKIMEENSAGFRKDSNTLPRICNIMVTEPHQIIQSQMLATRININAAANLESVEYG